MRSHLLVGSVRHRRDHRARYAFNHNVFYFALDLDELDEVGRRIHAFSYNRPNLFSLRDADHGDRPAVPIAEAVRVRLEQRGFDPGTLRTTLVTNARILGYVFNPVSFYLSQDATGTLRHVIAEVHNTHGERELYDLAPSAPGERTFRAEARKRRYVSPFIGMDAWYRFRCVLTERGLSVGISEFEEGTRVLQASLALRREPLTNGSLARAFVRYPWMTLKTTALIHWHALQLWLRGVPFHPHTPPPALPGETIASEAQPISKEHHA